MKTAVQVLEEQYVTEAAERLAREIDRDLFFNLLVDIGWTRIELPSKWLPVSGVEIHEWRERNLTGEWKAHDNVWLFEKEKDAVIFALKWA